MSSPYLLYTEYYIISGAYFIVDIINGVLTYSASYSDNFKGYLHSKVASKQVVLNEMIRNQNDSKINNSNDDDVDEDGFVVIKTRRTKKNKINLNDNNNSNDTTTNQNLNQNVNMDQIKGFNSDSDIIEQVVEDMIKDVIKRLCSHENITN